MSNLSFRHRRMMVREIRRLSFVRNNTGIDDSIRFAKQGIRQYTQALKTFRGKVYDDEFRSSIMVYVAYLKQHGEGA